MQERIELKVEGREQRGKGPARRLRQKGRVPLVLYGLEQEPLALSVDSIQMTKILASTSARNQILNVLLNGESYPAMAADWQVDPVKGNLLHVDLRRIEVDKPVRISVPLETVGVAPGVKEEGGMEDVVLREVEILCLPAAVPEKIEIDISSLHAGQSVRVRDLPRSGEYEFVTREDALLVHIIPPKGETAEEVAEEEIVAEEAPAPAES